MAAKLEKKLVETWQSGKLPEAEKVAEALLSEEPENKVALQFLGKWCLSKGDSKSAQKHWKKLSQISTPHWEIYLGWAQAAENNGNLEEAIKACKEGLKKLEGHYLLLFVLGQLSQKAGYEKQATTAFFHCNDVLSRLMLGADEKTKQALAQHKPQYEFARSHLEKSLNGAYLKAAKSTGKTTERVENSYYVRFSRKNPTGNVLHQPRVFYMPGLAHSPYAENDLFQFIPDLEAAFGDIKKEILSKFRPDVDLTPVIGDHQAVGPDLAPLAGSRDWAAFYFSRNFNENSAAKNRFPKTWALMEKFPLYKIDGLMGEVKIFGIAGDTKVPPHFGFTNTTLMVHLPLVVPGKATLKVGGQEKAYKEGQPIVFDDTYVTEYQNSAEERLLVLSFEIWHPGLSKPERAALAAGAKAENDWYKNRIYKSLFED